MMGTAAAEVRRFAHTAAGIASAAASPSALNLRAACERYLVSTARLERAAQPASPLPRLANLYVLDAREISRHMKESVERFVVGLAEMQTEERAKAQAVDEEGEGQDEADSGDLVLVDSKLMLAPLVVIVKTKQTQKKAAELQDELENLLVLRGLSPVTRVVVLDKLHSKAASRIIPPQSSSAAVLPVGFTPGKPQARHSAFAAAATTTATASIARVQEQQRQQQQQQQQQELEKDAEEEEEYEEVVEEVEVDVDEDEEGGGDGLNDIDDVEPIDPIAERDAEIARTIPRRTEERAETMKASILDVNPDVVPEADDDMDGIDALMSEAIQQSHHLQEGEDRAASAAKEAAAAAARTGNDATVTGDAGRNGFPRSEAPAREDSAEEPEETEEKESVPLPSSPPPVTAAAPPPSSSPTLEIPASLRQSATYYTGAPTVYLSDRALLDLPAVANVLVLDATKALDDSKREDALTHMTDTTTPFGYLLASPDSFVPAPEKTVVMDANQLKVSMLPKVFVLRTSFSPAVAKEVRTAMAQALNGVSGHERNRVCVLDASNSADGDNPLEAPPVRPTRASQQQQQQVPRHQQAEVFQDDEESKNDTVESQKQVSRSFDSARESKDVDFADEPLADRPPEDDTAGAAAALTSPYRLFALFGAGKPREPSGQQPVGNDSRNGRAEPKVDVVAGRRRDGDEVRGVMTQQKERRVMAATAREDSPPRTMSTIDADADRILREMLQANKERDEGPSSFLTLSPAMVPGVGSTYASGRPVGQRRRAEGVAYAKYTERREAHSAGADPRALAPVPIVPPRSYRPSPHWPSAKTTTESPVRPGRSASAAETSPVHDVRRPTGRHYNDEQFISLHELRRVNPEVGKLVDRFLKARKNKRMQAQLQNANKSGRQISSVSTPVSGSQSRTAPPVAPLASGQRPVTVASVVMQHSRPRRSRRCKSKRAKIPNRGRAVSAAKPVIVKSAKKAVKHHAAVATKATTAKKANSPPTAKVAAPEAPRRPRRETFKMKKNIFNLPEITISVLEMNDDVAVLTAPLNDRQRRNLLRQKRAQRRRHKPASPATGVISSALSQPKMVNRSERIMQNAPKHVRDAIAFVKQCARSAPAEKGSGGRRKKKKQRSARRVDDFLLERQDVLAQLCEGTLVYAKAQTERCLQPYFPAYAGRQSEIRSLAPLSTIVCISENMMAGVSARNLAKVAMSEWSVDATVASAVAALTSAAYDNGDMQEVLKKNRQYPLTSRKYVPVTVLIMRNEGFTTEECREQQRVIEDALQRQWHLGNARAFVVPRV